MFKTYKGNPILRRHREWLEEFKQRMKDKKEFEVYKEQQEKERFERVLINSNGLILQDDRLENRSL